MDMQKAERKLKKVKIGLMRNPKFALWSGVMMVGKTSVVEGIPTACTNGRDEMYGLEFVTKLDEKTLGFVILHENLHKAFRHLTTWEKLYKENPRLANIACDHVINLMLVDMDVGETIIAFPRNDDDSRMGCYDERFKNMNTKQVFDLLKKEQDNSGDKGGDGEGGEGFDQHDWEGAKELDAEEKKELEREIDQALRQGVINDQKLNGKGGGGLNRELGDLLQPQIDWREALREFVSSFCNTKDTSSWRRVNRRMLAQDVYMPSLVGEKVGHIAIGIDTSGSIGAQELNTFLSEVKSIVEDVHPDAIDLIYWDGEVAGHEVYDMATMSNLVTSTKPMGGGGTDPRCMMKYLKEQNIKPECIIQLTDGYIGGAWGDEWEAPIMWVITENSYSSSKIVAPVGKTIHIKG
jgi:predicted metal-dependent peptidase